MKQHIKILFLTTVLFLIISGNFNAQDSNSSGSGSPIIVTIDEFKMVSGDSNYKYFGKKISDILAIGLIIDSRIKFIDRNEILESAYPSDIKQDQFEKGNIWLDIKDESVKNILNDQNVQFIVTGNFYEYKGRIKIETRLIDSDNKVYYKESTGFQSIDKTILILDEITQTLIGKIIEHGKASKRTRSIGVICFEPDTTHNSLVDSNFFENIAYSLSLELRSNKQFVTLLWKKTSEHCYSGEGYDVIINKIGADVILSGKYFIDAQYNVSIYPILYINDFNKEYKLASVNASYFEVGELLSSDVFDALDNLIDDNGNWDLTPLEFSSNDYKDYLQKAEDYTDSKHLYLATLMLNKAIELNPETAESYILLGKIKEKQGRFADGLNAFNNAIKIDKNNLDAYISKGNLFLKQGDFKSSLQTFEYIYEQNPDFEKINFYIGKNYLYLDKPDLAVEKLSKALESNPQYTEIYKLLGQAYSSINDDSSAIAILKKALEIDPDDSRIKSSLGYFHTQIGLNYYYGNKYEDAKRHLYKAKEFRPKSKRANDLLRNTLNWLDEFEAVDTLIADGLSEGILDSSNIYLRNGRFLLVITKGGKFSETHLKEALKYIKKHIELFPDDADALSSLGVIYFRLKEFDKAEFEYERAIKKDSSNNTTHLNLIEVQIINGSYREALESVEKVLKLTLDDPKEIGRRAICYYCKIVALKLLDQDYNVAWKDLQNILDSKKLIYIGGWSFKTFKNWVSQSELDSDTKNFIIEKTDYMEKKTWSQ